MIRSGNPLRSTQERLRWLLIRARWKSRPRLILTAALTHCSCQLITNRRCEAAGSATELPWRHRTSLSIAGADAAPQPRLGTRFRRDADRGNRAPPRRIAPARRPFPRLVWQTQVCDPQAQHSGSPHPTGGSPAPHLQQNQLPGSRMRTPRLGSPGTAPGPAAPRVPPREPNEDPAPTGKRGIQAVASGTDGKPRHPWGPRGTSLAAQPLFPARPGTRRPPGSSGGRRC